MRNPGTGLVNPLTENQRATAEGDPLNTIDAAAERGDLTPGVLQGLEQEQVDEFIRQAGDLDPELLRRIMANYG